MSCLLVLGAAAGLAVRVPPAEIRSVSSHTLQSDLPRAVAAPVLPAEEIPARPSHAEPWWGLVLLGRLHPMVVHFPIALLTMAAVIEGLHLMRRRPVPSEAATYCLAFGVAGALVSAGLGTINAGHQTFTADAALILGRHQSMAWIAVIAAVAALGAGHVARQSAGMRTVAAYLVLLFVTSAVVGATGHFGGELVYGSRYLSEVLPWSAADPPASAVPAVAPAIAVQAPVDAVDFARDVAPILERRCVECHGPDKVKARLRMDSVSGLQKGGKSGALLTPGDPENSLIMRRVRGLGGDDRMPLDKDPLTDTQIDTLRRWIAAGAAFDVAGSRE